MGSNSSSVISLHLILEMIIQSVSKTEKSVIRPVIERVSQKQYRLEEETGVKQEQV